MTTYGSVDSVRARTGVQHGDLGLEDEDALSTFLGELLAEVTDVMDRSMRTSYLEDDPIPPGLNGIASDAAANSVRTMIATRQTTVIRMDDFAVEVVEASVLSKDIQERMRLYTLSAGQIELGPGDLRASDSFAVITSEDL